MSGLKLVIPNFTSNNASLPILREDKRLTAGSLLLVDFSHPLMNTSAIPANGSIIKNIAYQEAMTLTATTEANISPSIVNTITPTGGLMEFTAKKGLHGIISQVNDIENGNEFQISVPQAIRTYIFNNISRGFFVSIWDRKTRLALTQTSAYFYMFLQNTSNYGTIFQTGGGNTSGGKNLGNRMSVSSLNSLSNQINNIGFSQLTGTPGATNASKFKFGSADAYSTAELNKACSNILYQIHIMDLTSAGLTYAQADALDLAEYNKAFGVGGRFENDTFTSPSTLA